MTGLLANVGNTTTQVNYAFAIWDLFDGQSTNPAGGSTALEKAAFAAAADGYVANNVSVFTPDGVNSPNPKDVSQEFLVVQAARFPGPDPPTAGPGFSFARITAAASIRKCPRTGHSRIISSSLRPHCPDDPEAPNAPTQRTSSEDPGRRSGNRPGSSRFRRLRSAARHGRRGGSFLARVRIAGAPFESAQRGTSRNERPASIADRRMASPQSRRRIRPRALP